MTENRDQIALAAGFDTQNAEAVIGIVERDPVDQPRQGLRRARRRCPRHPGIMEIKMWGRYRVSWTRK
jgi:hypothetical protein